MEHAGKHNNQKLLFHFELSFLARMLNKKKYKYHFDKV